jgi:6-phosphofructokinase 1
MRNSKEGPFAPSPPLQLSPQLVATPMTEQTPDSSSHLSGHHLSTWQDDESKHALWPRPESQRKQGVLNPMASARPNMNFLNPNEKVQGAIILNDSKAALRSHALDGGAIRGNATEEIWWEPAKVKAALVTCGGLCPGLNSIIQGVTNCLWRDYGVHDIVGITAGYNGLTAPEKHLHIALTPQVVAAIHLEGGSILKAGRGGFDAVKACDTLRARGITHLFVIGGDGTQFAGHLLYEEARRQNLPVSVVGVPKSIDNDVLFVDRTFGFDSAVEAAAGVIRNGWVEATSCDKGVGIIKLMGRDAGFVAAHAALASNLVDLVLVPEVGVEMEDVKAHVDCVLARKGHMVIVVAEGAGQAHVATGKKDASGHTIYGDIGVFLRDTLNSYLKPKGGRTFYIDPSYIIRSVPTNPIDHIYCVRLANNAVHTAMRGYTGVCVGARHNIIVILKSKLIASGKKQLKIKSSTWQTCVQVCAMPDNLTGMNLPPQEGY